jgi:uncharacterized membrane protein
MERQQEVCKLNSNSISKTKRLTLLAIFAALVVILQFVASAIKFGPFSITLVLVPIVVGAAMCGPVAGGVLGAVFGAVVLLSGDAAAFLTINPFGTIVTVFLKGILSGLAAGYVYKLLEKKNFYVAVFASAVVCPIVNTGIFLLGCLVFFLDTIAGWAEALGFGASVGKYMIVGLCGVNFIVEMAINVVLIGVIATLIKVGKKSMKA